MAKQHKRQRDIKTKLMAAVAMLLVSSIMMVSSTYAWFTLSTAPEVTGINTAVGANGNLEMALLPKTGLLTDITSEAGDSTKDKEAKNVTWGNLVDLSPVQNQSIYGLDQITLFPAELSLTDAGKINVIGSILKTPQYGADGRISQLAENSTVGYFDKKTQSFSPNDDFGVRAVGTASGMTDRQLSYRNSRSAANTAMSMAANLASQSLNNNGSALANIAIKYGMNSTSATFDKNDVASLRKIINDLKGENGVLDQIETAYMQYILAIAASAASGETDTAWSAVKGLVEADGATLTSVKNGLVSNGVSLPTELSNAITAFQGDDGTGGTVGAVNDADSKLAELEARLVTDENATFSWAEIRDAMSPLANPTAMKINGFLASEVKEKLGDLVSSVTAQGGLKVIMESGAGVYADISDHCGDYTASVNIERVEYSGIVLNDMAAKMETASKQNPSYLTAVGTAVEGMGAPTGGAEGTLPITDMYGYIIDLAFRTNAAESKLLLQQEAADRIYGDNTNEETMGHGASMTFMATTPDFSNDQVKALMGAIRIVFFNPADGTIYAYAKLDTANATSGTDGWTAKIVLYTLSGGETTYRLAGTGETATHIEVTTTEWVETTDGATHIYDATSQEYVVPADDTTPTHKQVTTTTYREATGSETATHVVAGTTDVVETVKDDPEIMPLTQNQAAALSVLVYLDGNKVTNASVAATANTSMKGTMNLQFASSATLVPMEYTDLHIPGNQTPESSEGG